jgi:hypothetical protein
VSFLFRLETADGEPADPPTFLTIAPKVATRGHDPRAAVGRFES